MLENAENANVNQAGGGGGRPSFEAIRQSLRHLKPPSGIGQRNERNRTDPMSLSEFKNSLRLKPSDSPQSTMIGGTDGLPASVFGKELREKNDKDSSDSMKTQFVKMYSYAELGDKLRKLRPEEAKGEAWFSMEELNNRLVKLREFEEKESESKIGGISIQDLRESLVKLQRDGDEKENKNFCK